MAIVVDGDHWLDVHREVALEAGLRRGDTADESLRLRLTAADEARRAYEAALSLLSYRPRAEGELRQRLQRKGLGSDAIEAALVRLRNAGLVNDEQFARGWVSSRGAGASAKGSVRLTAELRSKGVAPDVVLGAVSDLDEIEQAISVALVRAQRLKGLPYQEFRRRLGGFLQRRGYGYEAITAAVKAAWRPEDESGSDDDI
ncbi:MAG: regulatory protein RecX [Dehalococcoidia bacterium]